MGRALSALICAAVLVVGMATPSDALYQAKTKIASVYAGPADPATEIVVWLGSSQRKCLSGRKVVIGSRTEPGTSFDPFGSGTTDTAGRVSIAGAASRSAEFLVKVKQKQAAQTLCSAARKVTTL